jgi:hypothetical protein
MADVTTGAIRNQHHLLARLAADTSGDGGKSDAELSALTGYSPGYIASLRRQRGFKELVAHYTLRLGSGDHRPLSSTITERLRALGFSALDELQARLAEDPASWSKRELMELTDLTLVKTQGQTRRDTPPPGDRVTIQVRFVSADPVAEPMAAIAGPNGGPNGGEVPNTKLIEHEPAPTAAHPAPANPPVDRRLN